MISENYGRLIRFSLLSLLCFFMAASVTYAKSGYLSTWSSIYPGSASDNNASCQLCHGTSNGNINPYGYAMAQCAGNSGTITQRIQAAENLNSDGDSGGFTNLEEIVANAQPGWTTGSIPVWNRSSCIPAGANTAPSIGLLDPEPTPPPTTCNDVDKDGYGDPADSTCTYAAKDCDDNNASVNPGAVENCTDGIDNDCDFLIDRDDPSAVNCPFDCTDLDNDGYSIEGTTVGCGPVDCNDANEFINPGAEEDCSDGIDNDCDNLVDGADPDCPAQSCIDYGSDRSRCNADPRCEYSGKLKSCDEIPTDQLDCEANGGRWNKRNGCIIR